MDNQTALLREAIALSKSAVDHGNEPFGAVLVKDGEIILRAENSVFGGRDMTNHAEMNLVKLAAQHYDPAFLADCTLYSSTEPCAMCAGAIYWSGIGHLVFACSEQRLGEICWHWPRGALTLCAGNRRPQRHGHWSDGARGRGRRSAQGLLAQASGQGLSLYPTALR